MLPPLSTTCFRRRLGQCFLPGSSATSSFSLQASTQPTILPVRKQSVHQLFLPRPGGTNLLLARLLGSIVGWRCVNRTSPANSSKSSSLSLVALSLLCSPRTGSDPDPLNLLCHPVHLPSAFPCLAALQALGLLRLSCQTGRSVCCL